MSNVKTFLKLLQKSGYPNPKIETIAKMADYNLDNFLIDLKEHLGDDGVLDFCDKAIEKLSGKKGIRVDLAGPKGNEYCYIHIYPIFYDEDESENDVISNSSWGESEILDINPDTGEEHYVSIQTIIDNTDMSGWGEMDELLDDIKSKAYNIVFSNCGFGVWWQ
jgi:hypothetical protein